MMIANSMRLLATIAVASACCAQVPEPAGRGTGSQSMLRRGPDRGVLTAYLHPTELIKDLATLVGAADLVVDATATIGVPINFDTASNVSIETESTLVIQSVIKGVVPDDKNRIMLVQPGGKIGDLEVISPDSPVVSPGGRYVLFLRRDRRDLPPSKTGLVRYGIVGAWAGLATVRDDKLFFESSKSSDELRQYDATGVETFLKLISDYVQNKPSVTKPEDLPEVPWPFTREEWEERKRQMERK